MMRRLWSTAAVAAVSAGLLSAPVGADPVNPKGSQTIPLTCDNGQTYQLVGVGSGDFTPGHVIGSNEVVVPVALGEITGTAVPSGQVIFSEPATTKGQSAKNKELTTCTFEITHAVSPEEAEEFGLPEGTTALQVTGSLTAFIPPARH